MSTTTTKPTIEELQKQIEELANVVKKQSIMLSKTGHQLLSLQVKQTSKELGNVKIPSVNKDGIPSFRESKINKTTTENPENESEIPSSVDIDVNDFITNQDIVQLVGELQGQLTLLELKNIRRISNSRLSEDEDIIAPIPNQDGEEPAIEIFPKNIAEFKELADDTVLDLCQFYELLPPTAQDEAKMKAFMEGKIETPNLDPSEFTPCADDYSEEDLGLYYDELARFIGLKFRRRENVW
ncbi:hypothetical protein B5S32_g271 [[Candida] boidinii]|nr:hypothetical protein B5S32_g271 [[Candida] boidinii]